MKTILVFEDDPTQARLMQRILEYGGYQVHCALNGEQGLQIALALVPDLILLDMGLPDIDGQTVAGLIKGSSLLADIPLVAVTAWPQDVAEDMAHAYGCDGYFSKPIRVREFAEQVARYFKT